MRYHGRLRATILSAVTMCPALGVAGAMGSLPPPSRLDGGPSPDTIVRTLKQVGKQWETDEPGTMSEEVAAGIAKKLANLCRSSEAAISDACAKIDKDGHGTDVGVYVACEVWFLLMYAPDRQAETETEFESYHSRIVRRGEPPLFHDFPWESTADAGWRLQPFAYRAVDGSPLRLVPMHALFSKLRRRDVSAKAAALLWHEAKDVPVRLVHAMSAGDERTVVSILSRSPQTLSTEFATLEDARLPISFTALWFAAFPSGSEVAFRALLRIQVLSKKQLVDAWECACSGYLLQVEDPGSGSLHNLRWLRSLSDEAIEDRQLAKLKDLADLFPWLLTAPEAGGAHALVEASRFDWPRVVQWLVSKGVDPRKDCPGALHLAASGRIVDLLTGLGASVDDRRNSEGSTPLHTVTDAGAVRALLEHGAKWDAADHAGLTPLASSIRDWFPTHTRTLLDAGADLSLRSPKTGRSAADELWRSRPVFEDVLKKSPRPLLEAVFGATDGEGLSPAESWVQAYPMIERSPWGHTGPGPEYFWENIVAELKLLVKNGLPIHSPGHAAHDLVDMLAKAGFGAEAAELESAGIR